MLPAGPCSTRSGASAQTLGKLLCEPRSPDYQARVISAIFCDQSVSAHMGQERGVTIFRSCLSYTKGSWTWTGWEETRRTSCMGSVGPLCSMVDPNAGNASRIRRSPSLVQSPLPPAPTSGWAMRLELKSLLHWQIYRSAPIPPTVWFNHCQRHKVGSPAGCPMQRRPVVVLGVEEPVESPPSISTAQILHSPALGTAAVLQKAPIPRDAEKSSQLG